MAEAVVAKNTKQEERKVFITIPKETLMGDPHPRISENWDNYEPGQTYEVSLEVAKELNEIIERRRKYDIRILRPTADPTTMQQLFKNGTLNERGVADMNKEAGE